MGKTLKSIVLLLSVALGTSGAFASDKECTIEINAPLAAAQKVEKYFTAVSGRLLERQYLLDSLELALISGEHLLLMGPPGNAKSQTADTVLGGIVDQANKTPSYYRIQMTPETTMSETHGPLDFKTLNATGKYERIYEEGMLQSRNVFIDEIFDSRANALRNILGMLNERAHSQGPRTITGKIETVVAATNKYISEVFEKAGDDSPKAVQDRFAFNSFVPGEFEATDSSVALIQAAGTRYTKLPELTFEEIDQIRALVPQVKIPAHTAKFLALLSYKLKSETEAMEQGSLKSYREKLRNGEEAVPPYRSTKYHSPRTLGKAAKILKAVVVREWLRSGGKRALKAGIEDVRLLEPFFTLGGPADEFIAGLLERSTNAHERVQIQTIVQEREVFRRNYEQILNEVNSKAYQDALELHAQLNAAQITTAEKEALTKRLISQYIEIRAEKIRSPESSKKLAALNGTEIGTDLVEEFLESSLHQVLGSGYQVAVTDTIRAIEEEQLKKVEAARRAEEAQVAEAKRVEQARLAQERAQIAASENTKREISTYLRDLRQSDVPMAKREDMIFSANSKGTKIIVAYAVGFKIAGDGSANSEHRFTFNSIPILAERFRHEYSLNSQVFLADSDEVLVYTVASSVPTLWIFSPNGEYVADYAMGFTASMPTSHPVAMSADGNSIYAYEPKIGRAIKFNWRMGTSERISATHRVNSESNSIPEFKKSDRTSVSKDGKKLYFTSNNMTQAWIFDLDKHSLQNDILDVHELEHFAGWNERGTVAFGTFTWDNKLFLRKIDFENLQANKSASINSGLSQNSFGGSAALLDGRLLLMAPAIGPTELAEPYMLDVLNNTEVNHVKIRVRGQTPLVFWQDGKQGFALLGYHLNWIVRIHWPKK